MSARRIGSWLAGAALLPLVSIWLMTQVQYSSGHIAWQGPPFDLVLAVAAGAAIGLTCLAMVPTRPTWSRQLLIVVYVPSIVVLEFLTAFVTACGNGDCL